MGEQHVMVSTWGALVALVASILPLPPTRAVEHASLAAGDRHAFVQSPGFSSSGYPYLLMQPGTHDDGEFGVTGAVLAQEDATLSTTAAGVRLVSENADQAVACTGSGSQQLTCHDAATGTLGAIMRFGLDVAADAPLGFAGQLVVITPDGLTDSLPVWIFDSHLGADMEVHGSSRPGHPGETITITETVINHGPSPQPYWGIGPGYNLNGGQVVGQSCASGIVDGSQYVCAHNRPMAVGEVDTVTFDVQISADSSNTHPRFAPGWLFYLDDPQLGNENTAVYLFTGTNTEWVPPPGGGDAGSGSAVGGGSGGAPASASPTTSLAAAASGSATPSGPSALVTQPAAVLAGGRSGGGSTHGWLVWLAASVAAVFVTGAAALYLRRRRVASAHAGGGS